MSLHNFYEGPKGNFAILELGDGSRDLGLLLFGPFLICKAHYGVLEWVPKFVTHDQLTYDKIVWYPNL